MAEQSQGNLDDLFVFVLPDDIKALAVSVLAHRRLVRPEAGSPAGIVERLVEEVPAPPEIEVPR